MRTKVIHVFDTESEPPPLAQVVGTMVPLVAQNALRLEVSAINARTGKTKTTQYDVTLEAVTGGAMEHILRHLVREVYEAMPKLGPPPEWL